MPTYRIIQTSACGIFCMAVRDEFEPEPENVITIDSLGASLKIHIDRPVIEKWARDFAKERLDGLVDEVSDEELAADFAPAGSKESKARLCPICREYHEVEAVIGGMPVIGCPKMGRDEIKLMPGDSLEGNAE